MPAISWYKSWCIHLQPLYDRMMGRLLHLDTEKSALCTQILRSSALAYRPLLLEELVTMAQLPQDLLDNDQSLSEYVELFSSFMILRERTIYFVHQSAKDYFAKGGQKIWVSRLLLVVCQGSIREIALSCGRTYAKTVQVINPRRTSLYMLTRIGTPRIHSGMASHTPTFSTAHFSASSTRSNSTFTSGDIITFSVTITNTGELAGSHVP